MSESSTMDRRTFVTAGAGLIIGFSLLGAGREVGAKAMKAAFPAEVPRALDAWISLGSDGMVTIYTGKVELGTGIETALSQIAAEELDMRIDQVRIVQGDTKRTPDQGPTWASISVVQGGAEIRLAAATARAALAELAATHLGAAPESLSMEAGIVTAPSGRQVSYGALLAGKQFHRDVDPKARVKPVAGYRVVGKSVPRVDIPSKVAATFTFVQDVKVPGMVHGRVLTAPRLGASIKRFDDTRAKRIPGFISTIKERDFIGVVARTEWAAITSAQALVVDWEGGARLPTTATVSEQLLKSPVAATQQLVQIGNTEEALRGAAHVVEAVFEAPYQTHGSIGPSCAVAEVTVEGVTVWSASQAPHLLQVNLAELLGLPEDKVRVIYVEGAGCYGRNGHEDAAGDAVLLARAIRRPVRVQWMRHQEHGSSPMGPAQTIKVRAALGSDNRIAAWETDGWYTEIPKDFPPVHMVGFRAAGYKQDEVSFAGYVHANQQPVYTVANQRVTAIRVGSRPVRVSWIRAPGRIWNVFAVESMVDELAALAKADAIEFRLAHLSDPRARNVIERVAQLSNWQPRGDRAAHVPSNEPVLKGRGFSYARYSNTGAYVAMVADVSIERTTGTLRVERIHVSHDCGLMVNPDGVLNQVQGAVIQTASRTLFEEIGFDGERVTTLDWGTYPIMRYTQVPEVIVDLVESVAAPMGVGEAATAPVPAAIANAVHDAVGMRLRRIPLTPERIKAALAAQPATRST